MTQSRKPCKLTSCPWLHENVPKFRARARTKAKATAKIKEEARQEKDNSPNCSVVRFVRLLVREIVGQATLYAPKNKKNDLTQPQPRVNGCCVQNQ